MIRTAAVNYLLDAGVQWGSSPAVKVSIWTLCGGFVNIGFTAFLKGSVGHISILTVALYFVSLQGVRDAAVELLHTLVAVHAEVLSTHSACGS